MKTEIIDHFTDVENYAVKYFENSKTFDAQVIYGYGGSFGLIVIRGSGFLGMFRHAVCEIVNNRIVLMDDSYYSDIVDMIKKFEQKYKKEVTFIIHKNKIN